MAIMPGGLGCETTVERLDGAWKVRTVPGAAANKVYRCPACDHEIRWGVPHVVAWPDTASGVEERRHWHTGCWWRSVRLADGR